MIDDAKSSEIFRTKEGVLGAGAEDAQEACTTECTKDLDKSNSKPSAVITMIIIIYSWFQAID